MKAPIISPAMLVLVCPSKNRAGVRATQEEQADGVGITRRHFVRLIAETWDSWRIPQAVRWCDYCGVSFWDLANSAQLTPRMLQLTTWDLSDPRVRRALELTCKARGVEPTQERLEACARSLTLASQHYGSLGPAT